MVENFNSKYILRGDYHHREWDNMFILILDIILLLISFQGRVQSSKPLDQLHIMQFAVCHYIYFLLRSTCSSDRWYSIRIIFM